MKELRIATRDLEGAVTVLDLDGALDKRTTPDLEKMMSGLAERGKLRVVVNREKLTYIPSDGMGVVISYVNKARNQGGDIRFCSMRDIAKTVITMLGLHRLFEVFENRDAAVASFKQ